MDIKTNQPRCTYHRKKEARISTSALIYIFPDTDMNIFRILGDLSHVAAIFLLLWKIWKTRSVAGKLHF